MANGQNPTNPPQQPPSPGVPAGAPGGKDGTAPDSNHKPIQNVTQN